ncbi:MAG: ribokinase [Pseudomonadota bacterium]
MSVLVIGNAAIDIAFEVDHLPRAGESMLAKGRAVDAGGKGLNQAIAARRAGAEVRLLTAIGDDSSGAFLRERLAAEGLAEDLLVRSGATDESIIWLAPGGDNCIVTMDLMARSISADDAEQALAALTPRDFLLMQGNLPGATRPCFERARERGATTVLNPAPMVIDHAGIWPLVDVAVVNEVESAELGGAAKPDVAATALLDAGVGRVVVTLGPEGSLVVDQAGCHTVPTERVTAVDTTGAGDVFCGTLAAGLDLGLDPLEAAGWAVRAATLSVTRRGTSAAFPSTDELVVLRGTIASDSDRKDRGPP